MTENYSNRDIENSDSSTGNCDFVSDFDTSDMVECTADTDLTTTVIFL